MDEPIKVPLDSKPRDDKGKFAPKRPLEFTWPHFWLEVAEIAVGILVAQAVIEVVTPVFKHLWNLWNLSGI